MFNQAPINGQDKQLAADVLELKNVMIHLEKTAKQVLFQAHSIVWANTNGFTPEQVIAKLNSTNDAATVFIGGSLIEQLFVDFYTAIGQPVPFDTALVAVPLGYTVTLNADGTATLLQVPVGDMPPAA